MNIGALGRRWVRYLPVLAVGHPLRGRERYRPFFIVGSGRSGTTLLRALLEAHPALHVPPETYVLGDVVREYQRYRRLPWHIVLRLVMGALEYDPRWEAVDLTLGSVFRHLSTAPPAACSLAAALDAVYRAHIARHKPSAVRWGDKNPANTFALPGLRAVFPDLQVLHIVRDGRDVVRSYLQFSQRSLTHFAEHWVRAVTSAQAFGAEHGSQYFELRYEELVRRPRVTLEGVTAFLGVALDERMLRHHELDLNLRDVDRYDHLKGVREPIYTKSIGGWEKAFDARQIAELERTLGPTLAGLGYVDNGDTDS